MSNFKTRLLLENIRCEGQNRSKYATTIHGIADYLVALLSEVSNGVQRTRVLRDVCQTFLVLRRCVFVGLTSQPEKEYIPYPDKNDDKDIARSSLIVAISAGYYEVVKKMLESGRKLYCKTRYFEMPLQVAIRVGRPCLVKKLLEIGMEEGVHQACRRVALQHAVRYGRVDIVKVLMEPKYQMRFHGNRYNKALEIAVETNHLEIAEFLIVSHEQVQHTVLRKKELFWWACRRGYDSLVVRMLDAGVDPNTVRFDSDSIPICAAAVGGHCSTMKILFDRGCLLNKFGKDAFCHAAKAGRIEVLEFILRRDELALFRPFDRPSMHRAFSAAAQAGQIKVIEFLLDRGFDMNLPEISWCCRRVIRPVVSSNQHEMLRRLISKSGFPLNQYPDSQGNDDCPMMDALSYGRPNMVDLLFQLGANPLDLDLENTTIKEYNPKQKTKDVFVTAKVREGIDVHRRWKELIKERKDSRKQNGT